MTPAGGNPAPADPLSGGARPERRPGAGHSVDRTTLFASCRGWSRHINLSPRECEIVRLVARDLTNKEIAAVLEISAWTVATHLRRVFAKLSVRSKAAMVASVSEAIHAAHADRPEGISRPPAD